MKILILSDFPAPYRIAVFKGLAEKCEVTAFFNNATSDSRDEKFYATSNDSFRFYILDNDESFTLYKNCIKNIKDFDIVLSYDPWNPRTRALSRLCMRKRIPYILNADGALSINVNFLKKLVKSFYTKRATLCFCGCKRSEEYFKTYGAKDHQIVVHPFSSVTRDKVLNAPLSEEEKAKIKRELGIDEQPLFISVGQFIHRKGFDLLLDAWSKTDQDAQLYIIGGGPLKEEYLNYIKEKKLKNVHIIDFLTPDVLERYYLSADVYLMPTREDIWGLVINEAMAYALPIITSKNCTAGNELVEDDVNGYLYEVNDTAKLAEYIKKLANDPNLRAKFAKNTLVKAKEQVLENIISSHLEALNKVYKSKTK